MEVPKEQILGLLLSRGDEALAGHADQKLPDKVDLERNAGLLSTLGVDPGELFARSVLAKFGLGKVPASRSVDLDEENGHRASVRAGHAGLLESAPVTPVAPPAERGGVGVRLRQHQGNPYSSRLRLA